MIVRVGKQRTLPEANKVTVGDSRELLRQFPANFFDLCVTSPPYFNLRAYTGDEDHDSNEIGRETSIDDYIQNLLQVFDAVWDHMKITGSLWVNIGDKFTGGIPMRIPQEFERAMVTSRSWRLVNIVVWYKYDAMAESQTRRFSQKWEPMLWFVKDPASYYWDDSASKIPVTKVTVERMKYEFKDSAKVAVSRMRGIVGKMDDKIDLYLSRGVNCGDVWGMPTNKKKLKHPAPFPEELVVRPIVACCPDGGNICDTFAGSGTVGRATLSVGGGRKFYGMDISPEWAEEANLLLEQQEIQPALF